MFQIEIKDYNELEKGTMLSITINKDWSISRSETIEIKGIHRDYVPVSIPR